MNSANNIGHVSCGIKTKLVDFSNKMAPVIVWFSSYRVMFKDTMYRVMFKDIKQALGDSVGGHLCFTNISC